MKRIGHILIARVRVTAIAMFLIAGCSLALAQQATTSSERYSDLIARTEGLPAYEAMFHMLAYQRFHPEHAPIYYRLAEEVYELLPTKDALHNYDERAELLYKARLFYGNCLHFLDGKMPRGETFPTITPVGKRVEYSDVDAYMRARLDTVNRWRAETDTLHDRFYRMVDCYESCRQLFLQFMEKYPSEKLAHLCFTDEDRTSLLRLDTLTRQLEQDKKLFMEALNVSPVPYYNPQFRPVDILVYRLDGVTSSDFLANDIPMWNYAGWTEAFLDVQQRVYQKFMRALVQEYTMLNAGMERFRQGQIVQMEADPLLPNRVERFDYHSPMSTFIRLEQMVAATTLQAQDSLVADEQIADAELSSRITASIEAQQRLAETQTLLRNLKQGVDESTARKYAFFLRTTKIETVDRLLATAEQAVAFQESLTRHIDEQLKAYANAFPKQFEAVDISDDRAASEAAEHK